VIIGEKYNMNYEHPREQRINRDFSDKDIDNIISLRERPDLKDFIDIYGEEAVAIDEAKVRDIKTRFEDREGRQGKLAEALEVVIGQLADQYEWLGEGMVLVTASEYDDLVNATDAVAEFSNEDKDIQRQAVSVDVSYNDRPESINKKIFRNVSRVLDPDDQMSVKYFESDLDPDFRGEVKNAMPIFLGLDGDNAREVVSLFSQLEKLKLNERTDFIKGRIKEIQKQIAEHPAQMVLIRQAVNQLTMYVEILSKKKGEIFEDRLKLAVDMLEVFNDLYEKKKEALEDEIADDVALSVNQSTQKVMGNEDPETLVAGQRRRFA